MARVVVLRHDLAGTDSRCPRQESNLRTRFRKPLLYPLSYGGRGGSVERGAGKLALWRPSRSTRRTVRLGSTFGRASSRAGLSCWGMGREEASRRRTSSRRRGQLNRKESASSSSSSRIESPAAARRRPRTSSTRPGSPSSSTFVPIRLRACRWSPEDGRRAHAWRAAPQLRPRRSASSASRFRCGRRGDRGRRPRAGSTSSTPSSCRRSSSRARPTRLGCRRRGLVAQSSGCQGITG